MAAEYEEYEEEEAPEPKKPKRPRKPIDWPFWIMVIGSAVFILVFFLITIMAPRRPFLALRAGQQVAPPTVVVGSSAPAAGATAAPAAPAPPKA